MLLKIVGALGGLFAIILPIVAAVFYFGQLDNRIDVLETSEDQALQQTIAQVLKELERFRNIHTKLLEHAHKQDVKWAAWDARWGHLIASTPPVNPPPMLAAPSPLPPPLNFNPLSPPGVAVIAPIQ